MTNKTLLIVEDHHNLRMSLAEWLSALLPDFEIFLAASGEDAIGQVPKINPTIAIVDVGLPGINGFELTRILKKNNADIKIIVLTILDGADYKIESFSSGADAFVNKKEMYNSLPSKIHSFLNSDN